MARIRYSNCSSAKTGEISCKTHLHRNAPSERFLTDYEMANFRDIKKKYTALNW